MNAAAIVTGVAPLGHALEGSPAAACQVDASSAALFYHPEDAATNPQVTPQQVKAQFRERGESIGQWADAHGYPRDVVYRVLNQRSPAWRGKTHEVAVALGLKPAPAKTPA